MALAECGHETRPGLRFCTVCGRPAGDEDSLPEPANLLSTSASAHASVGRALGGADDGGSLEHADAYAPTGESSAHRTPTVLSSASQAQAGPGWTTEAPPPPPEPAPYYAPPGPYQAPSAPGWDVPAPPAPYQVPSGQPGRYEAPPPGPGSWPGGPAGPAPRRGNQNRYRTPLLVGGIAVIVGGALAAGFLVVQHMHKSHSAGTQLAPVHSTAPATPVQNQPVSSPPPSTISAQEQAAENLSGLLTQSVQDRTAIVQAVSDVNQCGPNLNQDAQTFNSAASSRQSLLNQLTNLSGRSALPSPMLSALTSAWQNSVAADQDFARWAQDEVSQGCTQNDSSDPNAQAATGPDDQATTDKQNFVSQWNPIATQYGLPTYQWNQL